MLKKYIEIAFIFLLAQETVVLVGTVTTRAPLSISTRVQPAPTVHPDLTSQLHVQPEPTPVWITMEQSVTVSTVQPATIVTVTSSSNKADLSAQPF